MDTQVRGYPEKLRFFSAFGATRWIPSHLDIHAITPKALKNLNFSGYPLTRIFDTRTSDIMTPFPTSVNHDSHLKVVS